MGFYTLVFEAVPVTALQDLFSLVAPADATILIHEITLLQTSDVKDAEEEILLLAWRDGQTAVGSGGTVGTVQAEPGSDAFGGSARLNDTAIASAGTIITRRLFGWNVRVPFEKIFIPEARIKLSPSKRGALQLVGSPVDSLTMSCSIVIEKVGG